MKEAGQIDANPESVEALLAKVLASKTFSRSTQLRRFLEFTVSRVLEGRGEEIKEYTVAVEAYRRPASHDPSSDAIVRTEARRLRKKLAAYYETEGQDDPIRIDYPKGSYIPVFSGSFNSNASKSPKHEALAPRTWRRVPTLAGLAAALVAATLLWQQTSIGPNPRVAVLPFDDLSPGGDNAALALAASEVIISELSRQPGLEVVSRGASMRTRDAIMPVDEFIDSLNADYVIGGSFQRSGDHCRVIARLVRQSDHANVWSQQYSFDWSKVFEFQTDIARDVAVQIGSFITPETQPAEPSVNADAYEALARGRFAVYQYENTMFPEYLGQAEREFARAQELVPDYADALAELANLNMKQVYPPSAASTRLVSESREMLERALAADPEHVQSHFLLGQLEAYDGNHEQALALTHRAMELDPGDPDGYNYAALLYSRLGFYESAIVACDRAIRSHTLSARPYRQKVLVLALLKRFADAEVALGTLRELSLPGPYVALFEATMQLHSAELDVADATLVAAMGTYGELTDISALEVLHGLIAALQGNRAEAHLVLEKYRDTPRFRDDLVNLALVLEETDVALEHIAQTPMAYNYRWLTINPHVRPYLAKPEFRKLAEQLYTEWVRDVAFARDRIPVVPPHLPSVDEVTAARFTSAR